MADINNDGYSDLFQSIFKKTSTPFTIDVLNSDGLGNFTSNGEQLVVQTPINASGYAFIPIGDLNQSGWDDIIGVQNGHPTLYELDENGIIVSEIEFNNSISQQGVFLVAADFNNDGWLDIINGASDSGSNGLPRDLYMRWNNNGDLTGAPVMIYNNSNSSMWGMNTGDMDADGDEDILFYIGNSGVRMLRNLGGGNFSSPITITSDLGLSQLASLNIIDFDGDGLLDFSIFGSHYKNMGNTTFSLIFTVPNAGLKCAYPDLNGDGYLDFVTSAFPGSIAEVYINNANTGLNYMQSVSIDSEGSKFSVFDANGDGRDELLTGFEIFTFNNNSLELLYQLYTLSFIGGAPNEKKYLSMKNGASASVYFMRDFEDYMSCLLSIPTVTESYDVLQATPPVDNVQWVTCPANEPILGANTNIFHVQESGSYALYINNGICQTTTPCVNVNVITGDFDNNDVVNSLDFLILLGDFACSFSNCIGDLDGDGIVSVQDLILFISLFPTQ